MADKSLKPIFKHIEAGEGEMAQMRARLRSELEEQSQRGAGWRPALTWALPALAAAVLLWFFWPKDPQLNFGQHSLEEVNAMIGEVEQATLLTQAEAILDKGEALERWNANYVLTRLEETPQSLVLASQGLFSDPRPAFRIMYLEILLDHAGTYRYDMDSLENYIEQETDRTCLKLSKKLLPFAGS